MLPSFTPARYRYPSSPPLADGPILDPDPDPEAIPLPLPLAPPDFRGAEGLMPRALKMPFLAAAPAEGIASKRLRGIWSDES